MDHLSTPDYRTLKSRASIITIYVAHGLALFDVGHNIRRTLGGSFYRGWLDLDRLLVQFWESHSIRPRVESTTLEEREQGTKYCIRYLLPEITRREVIHLV